MENYTHRYNTSAFDAPSEEMAKFLCAAQHLPDIVDALDKDPIASIASKAAYAHQDCLRQVVAQIPPFPHLYRTDKDRFCISQHPLHYATTVSDPDTICETALTTEDLAATCFIKSYALASFVAKATCGTFHDISKPCTESVHHNTVLLDGEKCLIRCDSTYLPLDQVIAQASDYALRLYKAAFKTQLALCNLYLSMAQPVAG